MTSDLLTLTVIPAIGAAVGVAKLLVTGTPLKLGLVIGTAIVSGAIGLGALSILAVIPNLAFTAQVGLASAISVGGVVFLEKALNRVFGINPPTSP